MHDSKKNRNATWGITYPDDKYKSVIVRSGEKLSDIWKLEEEFLHLGATSSFSRLLQPVQVSPPAYSI